MKYRGVIFDLDGVICSTDEYHYLAWKALAERLNIPFDRERNNLLRGVSRAASLNIILEKSDQTYTDEEKAALAEEKNTLYREAIRPIRMKKKRLLLKKRTRCTGNCWAICRRPICPMM